AFHVTGVQTCALPIFEPTILESAPRRANVVTRIPGDDPTLAPLLIQGHLDVVPADATEWSVPPFSGTVSDGYLWGRGAVDMKDRSEERRVGKAGRGRW